MKTIINHLMKDEPEYEFNVYLADLIEHLDFIKHYLIKMTKERYASGGKVMTQYKLDTHVQHLIAHLLNASNEHVAEEKNISTHMAHTVFRSVLAAQAWAHKHNISPANLYDDNAHKF
jgi:hypothetical protein